LQITPLVNNAVYLSVSQIFPFFFSVFVISSVLALLGSSAMYAYFLYKKKTKWKPNRLILAVSTIAGIAFIIWLNSILPEGEFHVVAIISLVTIMTATIFSASMKKQIMDEIIVQRISLKEIEDEDILATERMNQKLIKKYGIERVLTVENVNKLKKLQRDKHITKFPVYKNLPRFAPYVFGGIILTLLLINPLAYILFS